MPLECVMWFLFDIISYRSKYSRRPPQSEALEMLCWLTSASPTTGNSRADSEHWTSDVSGRHWMTRLLLLTNAYKNILDAYSPRLCRSEEHRQAIFWGTVRGLTCWKGWRRVRIRPDVVTAYNEASWIGSMGRRTHPVLQLDTWDHIMNSLS